MKLLHYQLICILNNVNYKTISMNKLSDFIKVYYPIILAFFAMLYSIFLGLSGDLESAQYSAHWPATILLFAVALRQRRNDFFNNKE